MKKLLLITFLLIACLKTFAQDSQSDYDVNDRALTFGVKEGFNVDDIPRTVTGGNGGSASTSLVFSFKAGILVNFAFGKYATNNYFSVQPGLTYEGMGGINKTSNADGSITSSSKTYLYYLQLPVNVVYHIHMGYNTLYFGAGPYLAYGLRGKTTGTINETGKTKPTDIDQILAFGTDPTDLSRFNYGVEPLVGLQFVNGVFIDASADFGLSNIYNESTFSDQGITSKAYNRSYCITVGFAF
jgi:hypothetical protein